MSVLLGKPKMSLAIRDPVGMRVVPITTVNAPEGERTSGVYDSDVLRSGALSHSETNTSIIIAE